MINRFFLSIYQTPETVLLVRGNIQYFDLDNFKLKRGAFSKQNRREIVVSYDVKMRFKW